MERGRKIISGMAVLFLALFFTGCGRTSETTKLLPFVYTGSNSFEYYDVGNDRNADFLLGRAAEVCIPSLQTTTEPVQDYAYGLYHVSENKVLEECRLLEQIYPASTTKLMTALVALKNCNLSESVTISYNASHIGISGATLCGFEEGDTIVLDDLLSAMLVNSGNDAGIAVAEHVAGSVDAFVEMMNQEAKRLGAVDTHFVNPHGLHDKEHYTTAYDMYLIINELIHYNKFVSTISLSSCTINYKDAGGNAKTKTLESTNLFFYGTFQVPEGIEIIGGKTGTTNAAGCCLVLYFKDQNGSSYIAEVFGAPTYEALYGKMVELLKMAAP